MYITIMKLLILLILLVGVVAIFLSRDIVKIKTTLEKQNKLVKNIKVVGYILTIFALISLYFLTR